jgi:flagellar basal-body rod modification protein FlgD
MASAVNSLISSGASASQPSSTSGTTSQAPTEEMFLQLLVAQIQNQDPTNPSDSTQFVSQLAQFSELEQVMAIRGDIEQAMGITQGTGTSTGTSTGQTTDPLTGQSTNPTTKQTTT